MQGLPDPLHPQYATKQYPTGNPTNFVHKQAPGTKLLLQTNEGGWSAFSKTVKHYVAHMYSRGEHLLTPQSAPYKSGAMARAFAVTWKRSDRHTIAAAPSTRGPKVFSRPKKAKIVGRFSDTLKRARLETLTRFSIASMDTEVKASA